MLAKDFLYLKLQELAGNFPAVEIKYQYSRSAQTHIVELTPAQAYYEDLELENAWMGIVKEFMDFFPLEDVSFISLDSILHIEYPDYSFNTPLEQDYHLFSNSIEQGEYWAKAAEHFISKLDFQRISLPDIDQSLSWEKLRIWDTLQSFAIHSQIDIGHNSPANLLTQWQYVADIERRLTDTTVPGNTQYAMAA